MKHIGLVAACVGAMGAERVSLSYSHNDDGSCPQMGHVVEAAYARDGEVLDVDAFVRTAPAGTDCTREGLSYGLNVERSFPVGGGWDAVATFGASRQSTSATYALEGWDGAAHLVPQASLPAGAAETLVAAFGVSREVGGFDLTVGLNVVPVDFVGESRRAVVAGVEREVLGISLGADALATEEFATWGFTARWQMELGERLGVVAAYRFDGGLGDLASGVPPTQEWVGQVWSEPSARDWASSFSLGVSVEL